MESWKGSLVESFVLACQVGQGVAKVEVLRDLADVGTMVWEMGGRGPELYYVVPAEDLI